MATDSLCIFCNSDAEVNVELICAKHKAAAVDAIFGGKYDHLTARELRQVIGAIPPEGYTTTK